MRVVVAAATEAIGKPPVPRLAAGEAGAVLLTKLRGAGDARAERALGRQPSWRRGLAA